MAGIPIILSGPSGAGKTTLYRMAVEKIPGVTHSVSYTTRQPRDGDRNGVDYWFVDDAEFDRMVEAGEFIEHAEVHGRKYGTSRKDLLALLDRGDDVILEIDVQGAAGVRGRLEGAVYVFVLPPSIEACEERLRSRAKDSAEEIKRRLDIALEEITHAAEYEYIIINEDLERSFDILRSIITAEKAKRERTGERLEALFKSRPG